jgi:hypothetical protein
MKIKVNKYNYTEVASIIKKDNNPFNGAAIASVATHIPIIAIYWWMTKNLALPEAENKLQLVLAFYKAEVDES